MASGPDNWAYMILIEKGQFSMALHLAAIEKKCSRKIIESDTLTPSSHLLLCLLIWVSP